MAMKKQFTKTQWNNDREPAITAEQLNRMEKGIDDNDTRIVELDKAVTANKTAGDKSLAEVNKTLQKHTEDITDVNTELTSQGKAIGELADKKITKFYASSQGDSTLSDSDSGKMQDMMLYGKSEQKQYSGKNLLNISGLETITEHGVICKKKLDNSGLLCLELSGTATEFVLIRLASYDSGNAIENVPCILSGGVSEKVYLQLLYRGESGTQYIKSTGQETSFTVSNRIGDSYLSLNISSGTKVDGIVIYPMIRLASVTDNSYEPYVGGIPSPNPDYPQEIKSVVEPVVKVTGKNLLNYNAWEGTTVVNGKGVYDNNGVTITATSNVAFIEYRDAGFPVLARVQMSEGETITLSWDGTNEDKGRVYIFVNGNPSEFKSAKNNEKKLSYTATSGTKFVTFSFNVTHSGDVVSYENIQIEKGSAATSYEPYREQSVPLTGITLNAIPVSSGGNVTIDGQQYISDYVDVERGKIVKMVGAYLLPAVFLSNTAGNYFIIPKLNAAFDGSVISDGTKYAKNALCRSLKFFVGDISDAKEGNLIFYLRSDGGQRIFVSKKVFSTVDELNTFLTENSVYLYYIFATPTEESISDELAEKLKALQTYYPQTNLFITSNQLDGYAIFNYPISLANGWNYVKQQIGDTRDYIYDMDLQMAQAYVNSEYAVALTELEV